MNVLISSGFRWWNAEAAYAATLAELLREAGHGVWVLAPSGTPNAERLGALGLEPIGSIRPGHPNPLRWPGELRKLADLQLRHRIDVVDAFHPADYLLHVRAARRTPGLRVFLTRGGAQTERNTWLNRKLYGPWCDGVVTSCEAIRSRNGVSSVSTGLTARYEMWRSLPEISCFKGNLADWPCSATSLKENRRWRPCERAKSATGLSSRA